MIKNSLKNIDLKNNYLVNNMNNKYMKIYQKSIDYYKSLLPQKYKELF